MEITQAKGTSETHPVLSPNDEFADFELFPELLLANRPIGGDGPRAGVVRVDGLVPGSYAREALVNGVRMQAERGFNPCSASSARPTSTRARRRWKRTT